MKLMIALAVFAMSSTSFAWISTEPIKKEYVFKFKMAGESLEVRRPAASYEQAFEAAAQQCFNHFKGNQKINEERGLDIIDVCANPRS